MKAVRFFFGSEDEAYQWAREANYWRPSCMPLYRHSSVVTLRGDLNTVAAVSRLASDSAGIHPLSSTHRFSTYTFSVPAFSAGISFRR